MLSFLLICFVISRNVISEGISYNKECQWIGADGMSQKMLPIGVCKHNYNPDDNGRPSAMSSMYMCGDDKQSIYNWIWNHTSCEGEPIHKNLHNVPEDYFSCNSDVACPYAVVRFQNQKYPNYTNTISQNDYCELSDDEWHSEAPMTVYQCLNVSNEWYMMTCTPDGKGLIGTDYTPYCKEKLNETIFYDGCNYKDKYIKIMHCDYWDGIDTFTTTSTSTSIFTTETSSQIQTSNVVPLTSTSVIESIFTTLLDEDTTVQIDSDSDSDSHEGHHGHDGHHRGQSGHSSDEEEEEDSLSAYHPWLFLVALCLFLLCSLICCWITCKYVKQKKQIAVFTKISDGQYDKRTDQVLDVETGEDDFHKVPVDTFLNKPEGEITFK